MPQVHFVKRARKARRDADIKKGESYYWWKHRRKGTKSGFKRFSKTKPRRSQLTLSDYYQAAYAIEESVEDLINGTGSDELTRDDLTDLADILRGYAGECRDLAQEQRDKYDNIPENFQQGASGEALEARAEACECTASELETAADEIESLAGGSEDEEGSVSYSDVGQALAGIGWGWE